MKLTLTVEKETLHKSLTVAQDAINTLSISNRISEADMDRALKAIDAADQHEFPSGKMTYQPNATDKTGVFTLDVDDEAIRIVLPMVTHIARVAKPIISAIIALMGMFDGARAQITEKSREITKKINDRWGRSIAYAIVDCNIPELHVRAALMLKFDGFEAFDIVRINNYSKSDNISDIAKLYVDQLQKSELKLIFDEADATVAFHNLVDSYYREYTEVDSSVGADEANVVSDDVYENNDNIGTTGFGGICTADDEEEDENELN